MLFCNSLIGCAFLLGKEYHTLTDEEKQELSAEVKEYFSEYPALLKDYIAEESWTELNVCNPKDHFIELYYNEAWKNDQGYYAIFENCSLKLKNGFGLIIRYSLAKESKIVDHAFIYSSPEFPCNSLEEAIADMNNHKPNFNEIEWLDAVVQDFYQPDADISDEWDSIYDQSLQEINSNGLEIPEGGTSYIYLYRNVKVVNSTDDGDYIFEIVIKYNEVSAQWGYKYYITLEPSLP